MIFQDFWLLSFSYVLSVFSKQSRNKIILRDFHSKESLFFLSHLSSYTILGFIAPETDPLPFEGKISVQKPFTFIVGVLICKISFDFETGRINSTILLPGLIQFSTVFFLRLLRAIELQN
jgi:hypothetical protein